MKTDSECKFICFICKQNGIRRMGLFRCLLLLLLLFYCRYCFINTSYLNVHLASCEEYSVRRDIFQSFFTWKTHQDLIIMRLSYWIRMSLQDKALFHVKKI